jgi:lysophospholipase L1-like esterase
MSRSKLRAGYAGCLTLAVAAFLGQMIFAAAPARAASLGNVMPLGDSITQGTVAGGYRDPLYSKLTAAGYTLTMVGSTTVNPTTALTNANQAHHEGHSGYVIQSKDPTDPGSGSGRSGILDNINTWLGASGADPQYILLMIGTNDVDLNYFPATQQSRLDALVTRISSKTTGLKPNAHLIVAQLTPIINATEDARVVTYNAGVAAVVANHQALGENVTMVDMHTPLLPTSTYMGDNLHPNQTGYNKMADVWVAGIQAVPEPNTLCVFGGVAALIAFRRRRAAALPG